MLRFELGAADEQTDRRIAAVYLMLPIWREHNKFDGQLCSYRYHCVLDVTARMGFPLGIGIPWVSYGNGIKTPTWEWEWGGEE